MSNKNRQSYIDLIKHFSSLPKGWDNGYGNVLQPLTRSYAETFFRKLPDKDPHIALSMNNSGWLEITDLNGDMQMLIFNGGYLLWNEQLKLFEPKTINEVVESFMQKNRY